MTAPAFPASYTSGGWAWLANPNNPIAPNDGNPANYISAGSSLTTNSVTLGSQGNLVGANGRDCYFEVRCLSSTGGSCYYGRAFHAHFIDLPKPQITSNSSICNGDSIQLKATNVVGTCQWLSGSCSGTLINTGASIYVKPTATTTYYANYKNGAYVGDSCASVTITVNKPVITANATKSSVCKGNSTVLTGCCGASTYSWTGGVTDGVAFSPTSSATYTVTGTDSHGCTNTATIAITVNQLPTPAITVNGSATFCQGATTTISSNLVSGNQWILNGSNIPSATAQTFTPTQSGFYSLSSTDVNACQGQSSAVSITVNPSPTATITSSGSTTFCQGDSVTLTAGSGSSYSWSNGKTSTSIVVKTAGSYSVLVTGSNSCTATSSATSISINPVPPTPTITQNTTTLMSSSSTGNQWYLNGSVITGATSQFYTATQAGLYSVKVTNSFGCSATSTSTSVTITGVVNAESLSGSINVFPNPNNGMITLETISLEIKKVIVMNTLGEIILQTTDIHHSDSNGILVNSIDLTGQSSGIYFLNIETVSGFVNKKIIIQK